MPKNRIGFSSDFVLNNSKVGIATTNPTATLHVAGVLKGDFNITGVTTLTQYAGFTPEIQNVSLASTIGFTTTGIGTVGITSFVQINERETGFISLVGEFNTLSEDIVVDEGRIFEVSTTQNIGITTLGTQSVYVPSDSVVSAGTLESISVQSHFSVPNAGISSRPAHPVEGMVRFNDDLNTLEFWNGFEWRQFTVTGASGRGVFGGGYAPGGRVSNIDYINISSQGNAIQFGSLTTNIYDAGGCSSSIRGLFGGGNTGPAGANIHNVIEYVTIASEGNSIDFGDISLRRKGVSSCSSSIRGIWAGGYNPSPTTTPFLTNVIDYVQISTLGDALDFGDITSPREQSSACSSPTRGLIAGGITPQSTSSINSITISSTGNAISFGDLTAARRLMGSVSNSIRGVYAGGRTGPIDRSVIDFVTISSFGNAQDFGDLTSIRRNTGGVATRIRGVFAGGVANAPTSTNQIDFITIASAGNAQDFGDLSRTREINGSCFSDSHGGLGGF